MGWADAVDKVNILCAKAKLEQGRSRLSQSRKIKAKLEQGRSHS